MRRLYEAIGRCESVLAGALLVAMVVLVLAGGLARMAAHPMNWTMDLATCFFSWACFLCADIAWRRNALISIDLLTMRLGERGRRILLMANYLILLVFFCYLAYAGFSLAWTSRGRSFQGIPGISYSWVTVSLPIGALLLLLTTLVKIGELRRAGLPQTDAA